MSERIKVGMADFNICKAPDSIITLGLGSCVGIVLYDRNQKLCGMLHAMLPDSTRIRNNSNRSKFVDSGLEDMLQEMLKQGTNMKNLTAKMAGGAAMFDFSEENDITSIGAQNVQAAKELLTQFKIPLLAEDTGKNYGRTIIFNPETGGLTIRAVGQPEIVI